MGSEEEAAVAIPSAVLREWRLLFAYAEGMTLGFLGSTGDAEADAMLAGYHERFKAAKAQAMSAGTAKPVEGDNPPARSRSDAPNPDGNPTTEGGEAG